MNPVKSVKYGDYDMQANGCTVTGTDVFSAPQNSIQADDLAERDGSLIVKQRLGSKSFTVEGYLRSTSQAGLELLLDTFKQALGRTNQTFDIGYAGSVRRFLASPQNIIITVKGPSTAVFSVSFLSPDGMGWDVNSSALIPPTGVTQSAATIPFTVEGSYKAEPLIRVALNTLSGGTSKTITLGNGSTLRSISVTRTWSAGDVIEMDTLSGDLLVNGIATDYRGSLLAFEPGAAGLTYNDELTARDVTISANYTKRYR